MPFQEIVAPSIRELFVQQLTGLILSARATACPPNGSWPTR